MLPDKWRPARIDDLIRLGRLRDGGYVVPKSVVLQTEVLFGLGVSTDWSFEREFRKLAGCDVICYDPTLTAKFRWRHTLFHLRQVLMTRRLTRDNIKGLLLITSYWLFFRGSRVRHILKRVGKKGRKGVSIPTMLEDHKAKRVFMSIDIEGSEYLILDDLLKVDENLLGFVIEFHDVGKLREVVVRFIEKLERYAIVHIHSNNFAGLDENGDPVVIEFTFLRRDLVPDLADNREDSELPLPGLDYPNDPDRPESRLVFGDN